MPLKPRLSRSREIHLPLEAHKKLLCKVSASAYSHGRADLPGHLKTSRGCALAALPCVSVF